MPHDCKLLTSSTDQCQIIGFQRVHTALLPGSSRLGLLHVSNTKHAALLGTLHTAQCTLLQHYSTAILTQDSRALQDVKGHHNMQDLRMAPTAWAAAFTAPPPQLLVPFLHRLVRSARGAPAAALLFGPQALAAAGSLVLDPGQPLRQVALPLLLDLCGVVAAQVGAVCGSGRLLRKVLTMYTLNILWSQVLDLGMLDSQASEVRV